MSDLLTRIPPLREGWIKRAQREIEMKSREQNVGGVQYFADEFDLVPGVTYGEGERQAYAASLYGPPQDPMKHDSRRR